MIHSNADGERDGESHQSCVVSHFNQHKYDRNLRWERQQSWMYFHLNEPHGRFEVCVSDIRYVYGWFAINPVSPFDTIALRRTTSISTSKLNGNNKTVGNSCLFIISQSSGNSSSSSKIIIDCMVLQLHIAASIFAWNFVAFRPQSFDFWNGFLVSIDCLCDCFKSIEPFALPCSHSICPLMSFQFSIFNFQCSLAIQIIQMNGLLWKRLFDCYNALVQS